MRFAERESGPGIFDLAKNERRVAEKSAVAGVDRLGEQAKLAGDIFGLPQYRLRSRNFVSSRQDLRQPKGAHEKSPFFVTDGLGDAVDGLVVDETVQEPIDVQLIDKSFYRAGHARMADRQKTHERNQKSGRIEFVGFIMLPESAAAFVPPARHDLGENLVLNSETIPR